MPSAAVLEKGLTGSSSPAMHVPDLHCQPVTNTFTLCRRPLSTLSPQDGVYPEKVNAGRSGDNTVMRRIGLNPNPASVKFSGKIPAEF